MSWNHKGIEIDLVGSSFAATVGRKRVSFSSLNAVKKAIDKHLDKKAEEVVLSLPVVMRIAEKRFHNYREPRQPDRVVHGVITGIDPESLRTTGLESAIPEGWGIENTLPDTPENVARLERCIAADIEGQAAMKEIDGRSVARYFAGSGRNKTTYADAVAALKKSYESAQKGRSDE